MRLKLTVNRVEVNLDIPGLTTEAYAQTREELANSLAVPTIKNRDAISAAFLYVLRQCPQANPSDLWHHAVYRLYCEVLRNYRDADPGQSWKRASGDALEQFLQSWYGPVLADHGIEIIALIGREQKRMVLAEMGLGAEVGDSKLDVAIYSAEKDRRQIFGGVHVKSSLAERVSDDVPASRAMMRRGFFSPLWTLDVKSFPPTKGVVRVRDLINRGELGTAERPSEKRKYVEEHGEFDNCYSGNSRTVPTTAKSTFGKRIITLRLSQQPDGFARDIIRFAQRRRVVKLLGPGH